MRMAGIPVTVNTYNRLLGVCEKVWSSTHGLMVLCKLVKNNSAHHGGCLGSHVGNVLMARCFIGVVCFIGVLDVFGACHRKGHRFIVLHVSDAPFTSYDMIDVGGSCSCHLFDGREALHAIDHSINRDFHIQTCSVLVLSFCPNMSRYFVVPFPLQQNKEWDRAFKILDEMYEVNLKPDVISFGAAISACGKVRVKCQHTP